MSKKTSDFQGKINITLCYYFFGFLIWWALWNIFDNCKNALYEKNILNKKRENLMNIFILFIGFYFIIKLN
jgi:hypothetical protein